jgi:TatD-related deoxyribonuclease
MAGNRMAIFDNHFHLRPTGLGVAAAKQFENAGGTALMLTHSPYEDIPIRRAEDYARAYARTVDLARQVRDATRLKVYVALGPYPVDLLSLQDLVGLAAATDVLRHGVDLAGQRVAEGDAVAIGEVGRPHFPVERDAWRASNEILEHAMAVARERGCPVILHTEDPTPETFQEFAAMADGCHLPREKVVKHHSTPLTRPEENLGILPSILAKSELVRAAVGGGPFFLETDYIDDPKRPGAVLGPSTVPRKTRMWIEEGLLSEGVAQRIHVDLPRKTYGIETE